jgi:spoIIIJ-associated protein
MQEIDELVESVKLDAIKEEKKLEKPFTPDVKKESAPKAAPAEEKKPVKKEAVQVEKASEEAPAKAAAPKERPARDFQGKAKPAREKQPRAPKERQPKETRERAPKQGRPIEILSDPEKIREVEERAIVFLRDVFGSMDLGEVEITSKYNTADGSLDVDFEGEDMGILIGKRGQTLDSLQYLTSLVVNKGESTYIRVKLDTEDYRRRRKETLENLARGIAFKVKKTRKPVVLEPMNPYERRIIHASLQGNRYVETVSEGEEPYRHVVVKLKRNN